MWLQNGLHNKKSKSVLKGKNILRLDSEYLPKHEKCLNHSSRRKIVTEYNDCWKIWSYQVRCPTPDHLVGNEAACLVPVRRVMWRGTTIKSNKDELRMIYPHFCCVFCQKAELRKTPLSAEIPLCSLVPPESLRAIFAPLRSALCRLLLSARFVIGHRTVALRHRQCASALRRETWVPERNAA